MSTYLNLSIQTKQQIADWIERKLGYPLVVVEITADQLDDNINEALEEYSKMVTPDRKYYSIDLSQYQTSGYIMPSDTAGIFALESNGADGIVGTRSQMFSMGNFMRASDVWSTINQPGGWITYELAMQYIDLTKRMTASNFDFEYNHFTKLLKLIPDPSQLNISKGFACVGVNAIRPENQMYGESWVKRYSLALSKITVGTIRSKFQNTQLLGGAIVDGTELKTEGITERDVLLADLRKNESYPSAFFVG